MTSTCTHARATNDDTASEKKHKKKKDPSHQIIKSSNHPLIVSHERARRDTTAHLFEHTHAALHTCVLATSDCVSDWQNISEMWDRAREAHSDVITHRHSTPFAALCDAVRR